MRELLPLFPLEVVLFPKMSLPLHIFEERYKEMIGECLQTGSSFGILYEHDNRIETVGCTAEISAVIKRYPDGRLDLVALGEKRFQVNFFDSEKPYLRGNIELLADLTDEPVPSEGQVRQALELFAEVCSLMGRQDPGEFTREPSPSGLAFKLAAALDLQNEIRQRILEARSEDQRLEQLSRYLSQLISRLSERRKSARQAGSNGRLH